jgi:hypothetical protein
MLIFWCVSRSSYVENNLANGAMMQPLKRFALAAKTFAYGNIKGECGAFAGTKLQPRRCF